MIIEKVCSFIIRGPFLQPIFTCQFLTQVCPFPLPPIVNQSCFNRVVYYVMNSMVEVFFISYDSVETFFGPKFTSSGEQFIRLNCCKFFYILKNDTEDRGST